MNNIKVKYKMIMTVSITAIGMIMMMLLMFLSINNLEKISIEKIEKALRDDYDVKIKEQVESATSLVDSFMSLADKGIITKEEAMQYSADTIREIRFGEDGYFWIDREDGTNVVLLGSETEGTMRLHAPDADGFEFVAAIIKAAKNGGGYVDYKFPKEGDTEPLPKRAYSLYNEKTGWVIGTGNYIDDVDQKIAAEISSMKKRIILITTTSVVLSIILILFAFATASNISASIIKALRTSFSYIESMAGGDFTTEISEDMLNRGDDFGKLAKKLEFLKESVGKLIGSVKEMAEAVDENTYAVDSGISAVNTDIDDVSANTEELSAGFTETASSMDQITGYAVEIEKSALELHTKAKDAAEKILDIHHRLTKESKEVISGPVTGSEMDLSLRTELEESLERVKVVEEINGLSDTIMSIMNQTNLLALNAAIEAARAGEAGRGFSVVADEIRNLSEQSSESVAKIRSITSEVVSSVEGLASVAKRLVEHATNGDSASTDDYISDSEDYANYVDSILEEIEQMSANLQMDIDSINASIGQISDVSGQGAIALDSIAQNIMNIRVKTYDLETSSKKAQEKAQALDYEISKFAVRGQQAK